MASKRETIEELVRKLNAASDAYYSGLEIMSNFEWDAMFDELSRLEAETGIILPDSPTRNVGGAEADEGAGKKETHEYPALSLAKTKKISDLQKWAGDMPIWLSWKLDGLTLVATYDGGKLTRLLTRGNGTVGTNISYFSESILGIPQTVDYAGHLVVRGEATISYTDFNRINESLTGDEEKYANPRNLASGTLALDAKNADKVKERKLTFNAFTLVHIDEDILSWGSRMDYLRSLGFTTVDYEATDAAKLPDTVAEWTGKVERGEMDIPVDGLVITYDDTVYAASGSVTGHHATRAGYAFKWEDTFAVSLLDHIEWSCAASTITPIAVFAPVQLEGTTVSRASLCNISEMERLGIGENGKTELRIIKANKIIPKCVEVTKKEGCFEIPFLCPACGAMTYVSESDSGTKTLKCPNDECPAKHLKKFERFVSKSGMDIDGLSIETLRDFIGAGFISDYADIFSLSDHAGEIRKMDGYGDRSCDNLLAAIEKSRDTDPVRFITALSIPMIGIDAAKKIVASVGWEGFVTRLEDRTGFDDVDGIGPKKSETVTAWYADSENRRTFRKLTAILNIESTVPSTENVQEKTCGGKTFVITGNVHTFKNRDEFKAYVEANGGKVTGSVTGKTDYLVNNDITSTSGKNMKAKELGVRIISEDEFISLFGFASAT